ncbi:MAG: hypothetical protein HKN91_12905, partial [Acidimicrobiia bacterium]|nr:hypothetical protein [Acidimicrobiia bacterium]
ELDRHLEAGDLVNSAPRVSWNTAQADMAGVISRRAGAAAHAAATEWANHEESVELVSGGGASLWRHGAETQQAASLALEGWYSGLDALVATHARRRLRWRSIRRRVVDDLWRAVLGGRDHMPRLVQRRFQDGGRNLVATARSELSEAIRNALAADAERFTRYLGSDGVGEIYAAIVDRADILDEHLDGLAGQIPGTWSEQVDDVEVVEGAAAEVVTVEIAEGSAIIELGGPTLDPELEPVGDSIIMESDS